MTWKVQWEHPLTGLWLAAPAHSWLSWRRAPRHHWIEFRWEGFFDIRFTLALKENDSAKAEIAEVNGSRGSLLFPILPNAQVRLADIVNTANYA